MVTSIEPGKGHRFTFRATVGPKGARLAVLTQNQYTTWLAAQSVKSSEPSDVHESHQLTTENNQFVWITPDDSPWFVHFTGDMGHIQFQTFLPAPTPN